MQLNSGDQLSLDLRLDRRTESEKICQSSVEIMAIPDGELIFYRNFFSQKESAEFFEALFAETVWRQDGIKIFGKEINLPRLTAWFGDEGKVYTYSRITMHPMAWVPTLSVIKQRVEEVSEPEFNSVLLNRYRDEKDSLSWHSDDEPELGRNPIIASVSFGAERRFQLRHKFNKEINRINIMLTNGSLLIMKGETQHFWQHQIPKTTKPLRERINLTFRVIQ